VVEDLQGLVRWSRHYEAAQLAVYDRDADAARFPVPAERDGDSFASSVRELALFLPLDLSHERALLAACAIASAVMPALGTKSSALAEWARIACEGVADMSTNRGWLRVSRQAASELESFALRGRDVDQHDVGAERGRDVLSALVVFKVRNDRDPLGLEERLACGPEGSVRVDDQHTNRLGRRLRPVLRVLHAATMPPTAGGRIGAVAGRIAG
jgi:hypothetical protein